MDSKEKQGKSSVKCWLQTFVAGSGSILTLVFFGMDETQSAVMLPQLEKADSKIRVTPNEESWIAGLGILMAPIAALLIGPFIDAFGRKRGLQMFYFFTGLGYAVMACAQEIYQLYVGRIICGLGVGLVTSSLVYMVEICTIKQREWLFSVTSAVIATGIVLMSVIGGYLPWDLASLICSVAASILCVTQWFIPESPAWLFKMGNEEASIRSLQALGRSESEIKWEIDNLRLQCKNNPEKIDFQVFLHPTVWKPLTILVLFLLLVSGSGLDVVQFYSVDFVNRLGTKYDPLNIAVMIAITRLLACCSFAVFFRTRVGRRFATGISSFGMSVAFAGLGVYEFVYRDVSASDRPFQWLCVVSLLVYMASCVIGMIGLPLLMTGEMYPLRIRGTLSSITHVMRCCFMFVFVKIYPFIVDMLQIYGLLFVFAGFAFAAVLFSIFILPETKNKSLYEVQQGFMPKKKRDPKVSAPQVKNGT